MDLITVRELYKHPEEHLGKEINVGGWVRSLRDSKAFGFIVVSDGSFFETLQIVYHDTLPNFAEVSKLSVGTAILVRGTLVSHSPGQAAIEIQAAEVTVREPPHRIILFRRSVTPWSSCAPSPICVPGPIPFRLYSVCAP
mgnify:CR=1 FL=1